VATLGKSTSSIRLEFPWIKSKDQFAQFVDGVIHQSDRAGELKSGGFGYWDDATGTMVIINPADLDGGTAFSSYG
jgi:hypothetical protein